MNDRKIVLCLTRFVHMADEDYSDSGKKRTRSRRSEKVSKTYSRNFFELGTDDLIQLAKSKATTSFMKQFSKNFDGSDESRADSLIHALSKLPGMDPFALSTRRVPGVANEKLKEQYRKLREAAQEVIETLMQKSK